jgi:hypothetical protein
MTTATGEPVAVGVLLYLKTVFSFLFMDYRFRKYRNFA